MTAEIWTCDPASYHSDQANSISHSDLEVFRESPRLYQGRFITGECPREATAALELGTLIHAVVLEPENAAYAIIPPEALNADGHRKGAAWKQFAAANEGKLLLKPDEFQPVDAMLAEIH